MRKRRKLSRKIELRALTDTRGRAIRRGLSCVHFGFRAVLYASLGAVSTEVGSETGLITRAGNEGKLPTVVENIIDLNEFFAIIFDEPDIAMATTAINLHRNLGTHVIQEVLIVEDQLAVHVHVNSPLFPLSACID